MKVEFNWRDYDDYAKWLHDILTTLYEENQQLKENYDRIYNENCKLREEHNITDISLLDENYNLKKQKDDVVEYIKKNNFKYCDDEVCYMIPNHFNNLLRMLGETDEL